MSAANGNGVVPAIALEDVLDVEGYASWTARRTLAAGGKMTDDELAEVTAEAVVLIYELHGEWDPERCKRFSAFLITYLPRKLISWWRVQLRQSGRGAWNGAKGEYVYRGMVALDSLDLSEYEDRSLVGYGPEAA